MAVYTRAHASWAPLVRTDARFRAWEKALVTAAALLWVGFRSVSVYHHPWDSDEAQHLHVVWGWTLGLLPYRDFFDNHTPLFHLLFAPVLKVVGERADIVDVMRWGVLPLAALTLWCTFRVGAQVFSRRVGAVAALGCAFHPKWYFKAVEFRTDLLWTVLWMAALVWLTKPRQTRADRFLAGLCLGAALATSQKTVFLAFALVFGTVLTAALARGLRRRFFLDGGLTSATSSGSFTPAFFLGLSAVPAGLLAYFGAQGAWAPMLYDLVGHNLVVGTTHQLIPHATSRNFQLLLLLPAVLASVVMLRRTTRLDRTTRQVWLLLVTGGYGAMLFGLGGMATAQDGLPYYPLYWIAVSAGLFWCGAEGTRRSPRYRWLPPTTLALLASAELVWMTKGIHFSDRQNRLHVEQLREVLALTRPDQAVLDAKGGAIFRPRAIPYVMETLTLTRLRAGRLADDVVEHVVRARATVAINRSWFSARTKAFLDANYLQVGLVLVAGQRTSPDEVGKVTFHLDLPSRYVFVDAFGLVPGRLDGADPAERFELGAGEHSFRPSRPLDGPCYLLAESAFAANHTPFNRRLQQLIPWRRVID